jgi:hypothetical protein
MAFQEKLRKDQNYFADQTGSNEAVSPITPDKPDDGVKVKQSNKKRKRSLFGTHQGEIAFTETEDGESVEFFEVIKSVKKLIELCDKFKSDLSKSKSKSEPDLFAQAVGLNALEEDSVIDFGSLTSYENDNEDNPYLARLLM